MPIEVDTVDGFEIVTTCGAVVTVTVDFVSVTVLAALSPPSENEKLPMDDVVVFIGAPEITGVAAFGVLGFPIGFESLVFEVSNLKPVD